MANILLAAALLSGILAVSGCVGPYPGNGAYGYGGGEGYPSYGGGQSYPYDAGIGGVYGQPVQPYYQPQPYAVYDNSAAYGYQQGPGGYGAAPPGRWIDRRREHQEERIRTGRASGQWTPREARGLQTEQGRFRGADRRMRADGNLNFQERGRFNAMQTRSGQDSYRQRHNGVQPGAAAPSRPTGPARSTAQVHQAGQPRAADQPRSNGGRVARHDGGAP